MLEFPLIGDGTRTSPAKIRSLNAANLSKDMHEHRATLIVQRVGGLIPNTGQRFLSVRLDGVRVGQIGEEIPVEPGTRNVTVKAGFFTCKPLQVELRSGSSSSLEYHGSWLAWASIVFGCFLVIAFSLPAAFLLARIDNAPPGIGLVLLFGLLLLWGWLAFAAPLQLLAAIGFHSHTLTPSG
jgi:hypothetical protein